MSTKVDSRVVEMRFDNSHFEKNTKQTMSTLDKLKQKLNFSGASKGLDELNSSANKVNMKGMSGALDSVHSKFSALEVIGITALANITNSAVNAGKRMISALTIDPVKTGLSEYETQINAVQTIMANVGHKGKTLKDVNEALEELNEYADQTIYNFTEMTKNIGLFTNAGVDLDTSVAAIKGFSNAAAMAGADATRTAGAMYQLSQAMSTGAIRLIDWKSLEIANITGERFQETIKITARAHGIAIDEMIANEGSLRETLKDGWLTSDLMAEALNHYTLSLENMEEEEIEANRVRLKSLGYMDEEIDQLFALGTEATNAATKVKTFSQLWGVLQETAQSGWAKTWQIIIGDFEEAKDLLTPLSNFLTKIIDKFSDARNTLLEGALGKNWRNLFEGVTKPIRTVVESVQDYAQLVDDIISGKWGNAPTRWQSLEAAGYDWAHAQNLVNEKLGNSLRRATNYTETQQEISDGNVEITETTKELILELTKLSDAELKAKGYGDDFIKSLREMQSVARKTGIPLKQFIANLDKIDGRWILMNSFKNLGLSVVTVFKSIGEAWRNAFPATTSDALFNLIAAFHNFSVIVKDYVDEHADELTRTFKGLFAILDIIVSFFRVSFKVAFTAARAVLGLFNLDILEFTALVGDALVRLRDFLDNNNILTRFIETLAPLVITLCDAIGKWIWNNEVIIGGLRRLANVLVNAWDALDVWFDGLKNTDNVPKYIYDGLINGLKSGANIVFEVIKWVGKTLMEVFCAVLGIESPSKVFFEFGKNIIEGLYNGISNFVKMVYTLVMSIGKKIIDIVKELDLGSILTIMLGTGVTAAFINITKAINNISKLFGGLGELTEEAAEFVKTFKKTMKGLSTAFKFRMAAESVKSIAVAIAILAGSIALLTLLDQGKMWSAVGAITVLMGVLAGLTYVAGTYGKGEGLNFGAIALSLLGLALAMSIMAKAMRTISKIDDNKALQTIIGFAGIVTALMLLMKSIGKYGFEMVGTAAAFLAIGATFYILGRSIKSFSKLNWDDLGKAGAALLGLVGIITLLMLATKILAGKELTAIGTTILAIAGSIFILTIAAKSIAKMDWTELAKAGVGLLALVGFITLLALATKIVAGKYLPQIGTTILAMAGAMFIMAVAAKMIAGMEWGEMLKAGIGLAALTVFIVGLIHALNSYDVKDLAKVATTILAMSLAIGVMAVSAALLSMIDPLKLLKGVAAVGALVFMMKTLVQSTKGAQDIKGSLIPITVSIGLLALSLGVLSLINWKKLLPATVAMSAVMGMFAVMLVATSKAHGALGSIIAITVAIGVLAGALYLIAQLPIEQALAASMALSLLLISISITLGVVSLIGSVAYSGIGAVALMTLVVAGLAGILYGMSALDVKDAMVNTKALTTLLLGMSAALVVLSVVGLLGPAAFIGVGALATLIVALVAVVVGIGALMEKIPELQSFLTTGIKVLKQLATGIGEIIGSLVTGFLTQIAGVLPSIGMNLSMFMINLMPFVAGAKQIDLNVLKGIGILTAAIVLLSAANLIAGITTFITFGSSFADLGADLSAFMINAMPFLTTAMLITPNMLKGVKTLAETILIITAANLIESITSFLTGGSSLESFGKELVYLATGLRGFIDELGVVSPEQLASADNAAKIIKTLAEAAKAIPNSGGLLGSLVGENDMGAWATQLPVMAEGLTKFIGVLSNGDLSDKAIDLADNAAGIIKTLAQAAAEIPNTGGLLADLIGDNNLSKFAQELPNVGAGIVGFIKTISDGELTSDKVEIANNAAKIIKTLAEAADEVPNTGGWLADFIGDNELSTFAKELPNVGEGIAGFASKVGTFNDKQLASISAATEAIKVVATMAKEYDAGGAFSKGDTEDFKSFGSGLVTLATKIKDFTDKMSKVSSTTVNTAVTNINKLIEMAKTITSINIDSLNNFSKALVKVAKDGVKKFVDELSDETPKSETEDAAKNLLQAFVKGLENKTKISSIKESAKDVGQAAADNFCTKAIKTSAANAGKDLVQGLINGLKDTDKRTQVYNAAFSLGELAVQGELDGQKSNSPSKATTQAGKWLGEGLIIGIKKIGSKVYGAGKSMGEEATNSISNALNTAINLLNSDMDTRPTIRPVLDLSDVESGTSYLNRLFNNGPSVGVSANLKAISSNMNNRNQNGATEEVVSAINGLRNDLGNVGGNTYNVNGVTYDDGSNLKEAVQAIVRAAKIERRT